MEQEPANKEAGKRNWLYFVSPCVLAAAFSLFAIVSSYLGIDTSGGWSFLGVIMFVPILLILVGIDLLVKIITKKAIYVWFVEVLLLMIMFILYNNYIMA